MAALAWLAVQVYQEKFTDEVLVTLHADRIGNQLNDSSEVKARGVVVGDVRAVRGSGHGAAIELALQPDKVARIPKDVTALLIPKTLFGERYVQLSIPDSSTREPDRGRRRDPPGPLGQRHRAGAGVRRPAARCSRPCSRRSSPAR